MIKSKHFRKDVITARVIFLCFCVLVIAGVVWLISMFTGPSQGENDKDSELESTLPSSESESESVTEPESETVTESESESESEPEPTEDVTKLYVEVTSKNNLNLRKEPNTNCEVIASLPKGAKAELVEELDGWFKVLYNGHEGYVNSNYVKIVEE